MQGCHQRWKELMTELYNRSAERDKRQSLRNNMPPAERLLWGRLRKKQLEGFKFRRQYSIGAFVVDFYGPGLKLAIEVDGASHVGKAAQVYDAERQAFLESKGVRVLRFTNQQVYKELDGVVATIAQVVKELRSPPLARGD
jgi:very-short-patch-repair endonuclease